MKKNLKNFINTKSINIRHGLVIIINILAVFLSCTQNKIQKNDIEIAFEKYGAPVSIHTLRVHENISLYEYQSEQLYSILNEPNDTIDVYQIVFRNKHNEYIIWVTMKNDSLIVIDKLEYNYHNVHF